MKFTYKTFVIPLEHPLWIAVEYQRESGRITQFVVRLMAEAGETCINIHRYDNAHGAPHCDILDKNGDLRKKVWCRDLNNDEAIQYAIGDFKENGQTYYANWQAFR